MRALARPAAERYQSAEEMVGDLEQVMANIGGWVSPMAMGRFMRGLFPEKIDAWERAESVGASLGEHVAQTITSESVKQELRHTPVSMAAELEVEIVADPRRRPPIHRRSTFRGPSVGSQHSCPRIPVPSAQMAVSLPDAPRLGWRRWIPTMVATAVSVLAVVIALS